MSKKILDRPEYTPGEASQLVAELYGISGRAHPLPSERDQNFLIFSTETKKYVLKIANANEDEDFLHLQNQTMTHLYNVNPELNSPKVIHTKSNEIITTHQKDGYKPHFVRLLTYLPGEVLAKVNPHTDPLLQEFGIFMAKISAALQSFEHPTAHRDFYWDLRSANKYIRKYREYISDTKRRELVDHFLTEFEAKVLPKIDTLRKSIIHNDANDYNIVVQLGKIGSLPSIGIIDFGDMIFSCTIFELAVAIAYIILEKPDPLSSVMSVLKGYHSIFPLEEGELEILFTLICTRLTLSVCISAYQQQLEPDNKYLKISEKPAWNTLEILKPIHPRFAYYAFRWTCNLEPSPQSTLITNWLRANPNEIFPILKRPFNEFPYLVLDLSVGSLNFSDLLEFLDNKNLENTMFKYMKQAQVKVAVGKYNEARFQYLRKEFEIVRNERTLNRTIHIGIDLFASVSTPLYCPLSGRVIALTNNSDHLDYGPTVILEHKIREYNISFYTLYGHLSLESLSHLAVGQKIKKGELLGYVGDYKENGNWPPHLHFQIITDMFYFSDTFPGVIDTTHREIWLSICPNPNSILRIPEKSIPTESMNIDGIQAIRNNLISKSLSIAYMEHLNIVRGHMQYLFDQSGQRYLDAVNNVPHVGHSHPKVVKALHRQAAVLNTNTRYLHESLVKYAKRLCATLPDPLNVCFFVNSGSEANELALRLARTYTNHHDILVIDNAYHGNTGELINISPYKHDGSGGQGPPPYVHKVPMPDIYRGLYKGNNPGTGSKYADEVRIILENLEKERKNIAAFICEPLLGCGGQIVLPNNYLPKVFEYVRDKGGICIADEVQIGFGRIGTHFWGFQSLKVIPDIVTMGKPIGNGHPLAAVVTTPEIARAFNNGMEFFSTFGGNPVSCAVGMAVLDVIETEKLQNNALDVGTYLKTGLIELMENNALIGDVRGLGLFIGIELVLDRVSLKPAPLQASYIINRMKEKGILVSTDGPLHNVIKIKPPLVFTKENADEFLQTLKLILDENILSTSN